MLFHAEARGSACRGPLGGCILQVRTLVVLVKHWAKTRDVNDACNGTLSSYR